MPDFDLTIGYGMSVVDWLDPRALDGGLPTGAPSRLNPRIGHQEKRYTATVAVECELRAIVDGTEAPMDTELDARLFVAACVEYQVAPLVFSAPAGQSSKQRFTARDAGHYLFYVRRPAGGQVMVHVDAEAP